MASSMRLSPYLRQRRRITDSFGDVFENQPDCHWADAMVAEDSRDAMVAVPAHSAVRPLQLDFACEHGPVERASSSPAEGHAHSSPRLESSVMHSTTLSRHSISSTPAPRAASVPADGVSHKRRLRQRDEPHVSDGLRSLLADAGDMQATPVEYVSWDVELESSLKPERRRLGLMLQPFSIGKADEQAIKVASVNAGFVMDAWNAAAASVAVSFHPSGCKALSRSVAVQRGDEIVAIDGEPVGPWASEQNRRAVIVRIRSCSSLTFRRWTSSDVKAKVVLSRGCAVRGGA